MNGYERITAAFNGQKTDRTPMMLHSFQPAAKGAGISMQEYRTNAAKMAHAHIDFARKYDMDGILFDVDTCVLASAIGVPIDYPEDLVARVKGSMSDDLDILIDEMDPSKLEKSDRIKTILEAVAILRKEVGGDLLIRGSCDQMGFSLSALANGIENFLINLLTPDKEQKILTLIDRATDVHLKYHQMMIDAGADLTSFGDSTCGPDVISPKAYRKFSKPFQLRLNQELKKLNIKTICHICGKLDLIVEDLAEIGFDGMEIDYKTNIPLAKEKFFGKSLIFGPIDPSGVFCLGSPAKVTDETQKVLDLFPSGGIVIGAGCALPAETPEANMRSFSNTVKSHNN